MLVFTQFNSRIINVLTYIVMANTGAILIGHTIRIFTNKKYKEICLYYIKNKLQHSMF